MCACVSLWVFVRARVLVCVCVCVYVCVRVCVFVFERPSQQVEGRFLQVWNTCYTHTLQAHTHTHTHTHLNQASTLASNHVPLCSQWECVLLL